MAVYALNVAEGTVAWSFNTGNIVRSSPAVANGVVYVGSVSSNIYARDASSGAPLQTVTISAIESSPAVANGAVYVGGLDGKLHAFSLP
jgi:outer membrane protein assembly factor BamB